MNPIAQKFPWLTPRRFLFGSFALAVAITYLLPTSAVVEELVQIATVLGVAGAIVWGLTFWHPARVQIGRRKLKYRSVRRFAGGVALACLPFFVVQRFSLSLQLPSEPEIHPARMQLQEAPRFVVAFARFEGDKDGSYSAQLADAMRDIDPRLMVAPIVLNRTIKVSGRPEAVAHLEAIDVAQSAQANIIIWGRISAPETAIYQTDSSFETPFSELYLPVDFRLPDLREDDLCEMLRLVVATRSANFLSDWGYSFGDALNAPLNKVREIAQPSGRSSGWSPDTRARVYFVLGVAARTSAGELQSPRLLDESVAHFERALSEWSSDRSPLEWAMVEANLGKTWLAKAQEHLASDDLQRAFDAFSNARGVYQAHSDRRDAAEMSFRIGEVLEAMGGKRGDSEKLREAIKAYQLALETYTLKEHPIVWARIQSHLAEAFRNIGDQQGDQKAILDAVNADRAALTIFDRYKGSQEWVSARLNLARDLTMLADALSNRDYLKESIEVCNSTLERFPRDRNPVIRAIIQVRLGTSLEKLGTTMSNADLLWRAGLAFKDALSVLSMERQPSWWLEAMEGLAGTYSELGHIYRAPFYFSQAVDSYRETFKVVTKERDPISWAWAKYNLAGALYELGARESGTKHLRESVECYRDALSVLSKERNPIQWKYAQENMEIAEEALQKRGYSGS